MHDDNTTELAAGDYALDFVYANDEQHSQQLKQYPYRVVRQLEYGTANYAIMWFRYRYISWIDIDRCPAHQMGILIVTKAYGLHIGWYRK